MNIGSNVTKYNAACRLKNKMYNELKEYLRSSFDFEKFEFEQVLVNFDHATQEKPIEVLVLKMNIPEVFKVLEKTEITRKYANTINQSLKLKEKNISEFEVVLEQFFEFPEYDNTDYNNKEENESYRIAFHKYIVKSFKITFVFDGFEITFEEVVTKEKIRSYFLKELEDLKINFEKSENLKISESYETNQVIKKLITKGCLPEKIKDIFDFEGENDLEDLKVIVNIKLSKENKNYENFLKDPIWVQYRNLKYKRADIKIVLEKVIKDDFFIGTKAENIIFSGKYFIKDLNTTALEVFDSFD